MSGLGEEILHRLELLHREVRQLTGAMFTVGLPSSYTATDALENSISWKLRAERAEARVLEVERECQRRPTTDEWNEVTAQLIKAEAQVEKLTVNLRLAVDWAREERVTSRSLRVTLAKLRDSLNGTEKL